MIFVDSNVLIDVIAHDPTWKSWAVDRIADLGSKDALRINAIIVAEVAPRMGSLVAFYREMTELDIEMDDIIDEAAFAAGMAFQAYRRNKGGAPSVLPDFFIGGHAEIRTASILTRDPRFYRTYFPTVPLITPETDQA